MKAQAVVFEAPGEVTFRQVGCPQPGPRDVVVRVTYSWISNGTEGSFLRGERIAGDTPYRPGDPVPFPLVPGYQKVGLVEWVGPEVDDIELGEMVFAAMGKVEEMYELMGGHVSPSVSPREQIWKLPADVLSAGLDPLAFSGLVLTQVGYNCGTRAPVHVGEVAVVLGDGMVGQWAAQTLAWRGAEVILVGHHDYRLDLFAEGPLRRRLNARAQGNWVQAVRDLAPGGIQVLVDTVGSIDSVEALVPLMQRHGRIVSAGFYGTDDHLPLQPLRARELAVDMVSGWALERMNHTRALVAAGVLETLPLITHHLPAHQVAEAWELIASKREPVLGVILQWG
jgi:2-desacetyl-2-hydroxyethyl bacteriochlorophyllide A dehydrogenase